MTPTIHVFRKTIVLSDNLTIPRTRRPRTQGFTLIEIALAMFVIVIGMLPILSLLLASRRLDAQAQVKAAAYHAAWDTLETLRVQSLADRPATTYTAFTLPSSVTQAYPAEGLTGSYSVVAVAGLGDTKHVVQQIAVSVSWKNATAAGTVISSERVSTYVTQGAGR